jgi:hypothetical protein
MPGAASAAAGIKRYGMPWQEKAKPSGRVRLAAF